MAIRRHRGEHGRTFTGTDMQHARSAGSTFFATLMAAMAGAQARPVPAQPAAETACVHIVGAAAEHSVPHSDGLTVLEAVTLAQPAASVALDRVVLVRMGDDLLMLRIDFRRMVLVGDTRLNARLMADDYLVFLPKPAAAETLPADEWLDALLGTELPLDTRARLLTHRMLHDRDAAVRARTALELGVLGGAAAHVVPRLVQALTDEILVRREAIVALGMLGAEAAAATAPLTELAKGEDAQSAARARAALARIRAATERPPATQTSPPTLRRGP